MEIAQVRDEVHKEMREFRTVIAELRVDDADGGLVGYAAKYDVWSVPMMGFKERIAKGAFDRALAEEQDVRALWNHDSNFVLGRSTNGTLTMATDDTGLRVHINPPDAQWARDLMESVKRGDIDQMSFGFKVPKGGDTWWQEKDSKEVLRELRDVDLFDVSPVTFPAYPQTSLDARDQHLMVAARKADHGMILTNEEREAVEQLEAAWGNVSTTTEVKDEPADAGERQRMLVAFAHTEDQRYKHIGRRYA